MDVQVGVGHTDAAVMEGLRQAVGTQTFAILPHPTKKPERQDVDYAKLIALEERRLDRAKEAYLAGVDTIEQYAKTKDDISGRIAELTALRDKDNRPETIDVNAYAHKVAEVVEYINRPDISPKAKNEALRTIVEKIVFDKPNGNVAIYFQGE